jgi:hypothetical protein
MSATLQRERTSRKFWAWHGDFEMPSLVTGYDCLPTERAWWCPEAGYTLWEGTSLFETEQDALRKALEAARERDTHLRQFICAVEDKLADFLYPITDADK